MIFCVIGIIILYYSCEGSRCKRKEDNTKKLKKNAYKSLSCIWNSYVSVSNCCQCLHCKVNRYRIKLSIWFVFKTTGFNPCWECAIFNLIILLKFSYIYPNASNEVTNKNQCDQEEEESFLPSSYLNNLINFSAYFTLMLDDFEESEQSCYLNDSVKFTYPCHSYNLVWIWDGF